MTPSLEGWPTKTKEAPSPHEVRLAPLDTTPVFSKSRGKEKCSKENFLEEARYFELVPEKKIHRKADTEEKLKVAKRFLEMEKNI